MKSFNEQKMPFVLIVNLLIANEATLGVLVP